MKNTSKIYIAILFFAVGAQLSCLAQNSKFSDTLSPFTSKSAGPEYKRSSFHEMLWGKNYRQEWSTSIKVPVILLDTLKGGLIPYQEGRGHQSKSLRLHNNSGKEYALRSVNKSVSKLVPETYQNTFIQDIVQDEISMSHPYGAVAIPVMAQSAGILHTNPEFVFLPHQQALDTFNNKYGNDLYLFEQKAGGNWKDANNLGNFTEFIG